MLAKPLVKARKVARLMTRPTWRAGLMSGVAETDASMLGSFAVPYGQLAIVLVVGGFAGVLAGIRPARRAARLDVLSAVSAD